MITKDELPPDQPPPKKKKDETQNMLDELTKEGEALINAARIDIDELDNTRQTIQSEISSEFKRLREVIDSAETDLYKRLEDVYTTQDKRLQHVIHDLHCAVEQLFTLSNSNINVTRETAAEASVAVRRVFDQARAALMLKQTHCFTKPPHELRLGDYRLDTTTEVRAMPFAPADVRPGPLLHGAVHLRWDAPAQQDAQLAAAGLSAAVRYQVRTKALSGDSSDTGNVCSNVAECTSCDVMYYPSGLTPGKRYEVRVRAGCRGVWGPWSRPAEVAVPEWGRWCAWKECPGTVDPVLAYRVSGATRRWATQTGDYWCTIVGNTPLGVNGLVRWGARILASKECNGAGIFVGVAPEDINQSEDENFEKCGWYLNCGDFTLHSGPPHSYGYDGPAYGPRREYGRYVTTGDTVLSVVDTKLGSLSFAVQSGHTNRCVNINENGVAYKGIPLDKPLVPAVILFYKKDAVELLV